MAIAPRARARPVEKRRQDGPSRIRKRVAVTTDSRRRPVESAPRASRSAFGASDTDRRGVILTRIGAMADSASQSSASLEIRLIDAVDPGVVTPAAPIVGPSGPIVQPIAPIVQSAPPVVSDSAKPTQMGAVNAAASESAIGLREFQGAVAATTTKLKENLEKLSQPIPVNDQFNFRFDSTQKPGTVVPQQLPAQSKAADEFSKQLDKAARDIASIIRNMFSIYETTLNLQKSEAQTIIRDRNTILARIKTVDAWTDRIAAGAAAAGAIGGAKIGAAATGGNPIGAASGAIIGGAGAYYAVKAVGKAITSVDEKFLTYRDELLEQNQKYAAYNGPLAGALAQRGVAARQMDIREASIFGPELAKFTKAQSDLDIAMREATQIQTLAAIAENTKKAEEHTRDIKKANEELKKFLSEDQKKKLEEAERNRKDPLTDFLDALSIPVSDPRPAKDDKLRKQRDADLAAPIFGG